MFRTLRIMPVLVAALGCVPDPCSDPTSPEDFSACLPLCGKASATAAECHLEKPAFPSGLFRTDYEGLLETLELLSIPGLRESLAEAEADIAAGRIASIDDVLGDG